ncbi:MAG: carboxypeptidase regulatory-like domain-containing protein, partial [Pyrinomonadaceae bacterium]
DVPGSMAIQSDGKIVLGGRSDGQFAVVRYLAAPGIEGDVASRPNGDGSVLSNDVVQVRRFLNGTHTPDPSTNEFQRADSFPFETKGDGVINSADVVQTRRYQNGTSPQQTAGGPLQAGGAEAVTDDEVDKTKAESKSPEGNPREVRVESTSGSAGQMVTVNIRVNAVGNKAEYGFIINYDATVLSNPVIGAGTAGASVRSCNTATAGAINCSVGGFPNNNPTSSDAGIGEIGAGTNQLLITVTFTVAANAPVGATPVTLSNVNASSDAPQLFTPTATGGTVTILAPTAAAVSVSGRVQTAQGRGIGNVRLTMTDQSGNMRTTSSTSFGYFRFENVAAGETYIITARGKRFTFSQPSQVLNVNDDTDEINFIGYASSFLR